MANTAELIESQYKLKTPDDLAPLLDTYYWVKPLTAHTSITPGGLSCRNG